MNSTNKRSPGARGVPQPFNRQAGHAPQHKPAVAQPKAAVSAQSVKRPVAPPVFRPQPTPRVLQAKSNVQASASNRQNAPVRPHETVGNAPKIKRDNPGSGVIQRFYLESANGIVWKDNKKWDANKYVASQNQPYFFYTVYKLNPPIVSKAKAPVKKTTTTSSAVKPLTLSNKEKFKKLSAIIKKMQQSSSKNVYNWAKSGEFKQIEVYVKIVDQNLQKNESYEIKDTVEKMLKDAIKLKSEFDSWNPGKDERDEKEGFVYKPVINLSGIASSFSLSNTVSVSSSSSSAVKPVTVTQPVNQNVIVNNPTDTVANWLYQWGWNVNASGLSYYEKTYNKKRNKQLVMTAAHITLPMVPSDSSKLVTAATASGIWVGRAVHITSGPYRGGSKYNARIWYQNGWVGSMKQHKYQEEIDGENWLMWLASDITTSAGFSGTITK